mmetsp:Transcript_30192/g.47272  ORF Transcript_30192/g.47272 Transcript_30192/m.47272 type:complete len:84 (+) Transcript_30192:39-290(+)
MRAALLHALSLIKLWTSAEGCAGMLWHEGSSVVCPPLAGALSYELEVVIRDLLMGGANGFFFFHTLKPALSLGLGGAVTAVIG